MTILYSVISRGTTILARHASCAGNFQEVTEQILKQIPPEDSKLTYSHENYLFHYVSENTIIYMCITDDEFERSRAFLFLNVIKKKFQSMYGNRVLTAIAYSLNSEFARILENEMKYYSCERDVDKISRVHGQLDELKEIMVKNIGKVNRRTKPITAPRPSPSNLAGAAPLMYSSSNVSCRPYPAPLDLMPDNVVARGERIELLINKAENLTSNSVSFRQSSRTLARALFWKNVKFYLVLALISFVILYIIISIACGGLAWQSCVR